MYAKFDKIVLYDHTVRLNDRDCSSQKCPFFVWKFCIYLASGPVKLYL